MVTKSNNPRGTSLSIARQDCFLLFGTLPFEPCSSLGSLYECCIHGIESNSTQKQLCSTVQNPWWETFSWIIRILAPRIFCKVIWNLNLLMNLWVDSDSQQWFISALTTFTVRKFSASYQQTNHLDISTWLPYLTLHYDFIQSYWNDAWSLLFCGSLSFLDTF